MTQAYINVLDDLLDDLSLAQYHDLMTWLWVNKHRVSRPNIVSWRRTVGLPIKD